jgi:holo-[acyl-carrier protein] synthase
MIIGIGCDIVELDRFARTIKRAGPPILSRLFTPGEIAYCQKFSNPIPHYAGRFAAKEALSKALGVGIGKQLTWHDMEIVNNDRGRPSVIWHIDVNVQYQIAKTHLSISHSETVAIAQALLEGIAS